MRQRILLAHPQQVNIRPCQFGVVYKLSENSFWEISLRISRNLERVLVFTRQPKKAIWFLFSTRLVLKLCDIYELAAKS